MMKEQFMDEEEDQIFKMLKKDSMKIEQVKSFGNIDSETRRESIISNQTMTDPEKILKIGQQAQSEI